MLKRGQAGYFLVLAVLAVLIITLISLSNTSNTPITGLAIGDTCIDTDNGQDFNLTGIVSYTNITTGITTNFTDFCINSTTLTEYYCNPTNDTISIENFCNLGCLNGACNTNNICLDSDSGQNSTIQGTTIGRNASNPNQNITGIDTCINSTSLTEYYCGSLGNDYLISNTITCTNNCATGACATSNCTPSFNPINTTCQSNDRLTTYYNDTNSCNDNTNKPTNETHNCDFDGNGLIGNFNSFTSSGGNLEVYVDNSTGNSSSNFTGTRTIEFREGNITRIEFDWDFNNRPLDMDIIDIKRQGPNNNKGYILIENIDARKKVKVDKISSSSSSVCVEEAQVSSINSISSNCNGINERLVNCPGSNETISCSLESENNLFVIDGIDNSAILEFLPLSPGSGCTSDWNCTTFSACIGGSQIRVCMDNNLCGDNSTKPVETQSCGSGTSCNPNWQCSDWNPTECPQNTSSQTRTCTDRNNCGTIEGKPLEQRVCKSEGSDFTWLFWGVIIILTLSILVVGALIIRFWLKEKGTPIKRIKKNQANYGTNINRGRGY
ncbi:MAG: hypothetical protein ACE5ES_04315 [Candidatus Nanoarchaeia archaeon]